jgi:hypothetical protein
MGLHGFLGVYAVHSMGLYGFIWVYAVDNMGLYKLYGYMQYLIWVYMGICSR